MTDKVNPLTDVNDETEADRLRVLERKAAAFDKLRELMGFVENASDLVLVLKQDVAAWGYRVTAYTEGERDYHWTAWGDSLLHVVEQAHEAHGKDWES